MKVEKVFQPLRNTRSLAKPEREALETYLEREGAGSIEEAAQDEEWRDLTAVRLSMGGTRYLLLLGATGDGAVFAGAENVGDIVQHHGALRLEREVFEALALAIKGLELPSRVSLTLASGAAAKTPADKAKAPTEAGSASALEAELDKIAADRAADPSSREPGRALNAMVERVFGPWKRWQPYPKRPFASLSPIEQRYVRLLVECKATRSSQHAGLTVAWMLPRFIGAEPGGPADVEVPRLSLPFWILAANVASGHLEPELASAAVRELDPAALREAWLEVAAGEAYDTLECWSTEPKEQDISFTHRRVAYQARLFAWMGEVARAIGPELRPRALEIARAQAAPSRFAGWGWRAFCALAGLEVTGGIPAELDPLVVELVKVDLVGKDAWAPELVKRWYDAMGRERQAVVGPLEKARKPRI
jgi:hypothetical protein